MSAAWLHGSSSRRGSVLVMVVAVLAMLFIVGTTQLMMARFERRLSEEKTVGTQTKETAGSAIIPPAVNMGEDARGVDGAAYNRSWNPAETSPIEDGSDFPGTPVFLGTDTPEIRLQKASRAGDLLLSSLEPYYGTDALNVPGWVYPFMSWSKDAITDTNGSLTIDPPSSVLNTIGELPGTLELTALATPIVAGTPLKSEYRDSYRDLTTNVLVSSKPCADIDGDGIVDGRWVGSMAGCDLYQRIISHGGMVTIDRMTHPALLAQVIHPRDAFFCGTTRYYRNEPWTLFTGDSTCKPPVPPWNGTFTDSVKKEDEARLRRRFMLPGSTQVNATTGSDWRKLPDGDLRTLLPYTLGYRTPDSRFVFRDNNGQGIETPHYWRVGTAPDGVKGLQTELDWWQSRIAPVSSSNGTITLLPGLTETGYNAAVDMYDRRHLLTTHNSDDLLRPNRDEKGGVVIESPPGTVLVQYPGIHNAGVDTLPTPALRTPSNAPLRPFYYILNPETSAATDVLGFPVLPAEAYGAVSSDNWVTWSLVFNKPGLRTPFSLRDVLVDPVSNGTYQASYRRARQLTAYYLAMLQHTTVGGAVPGTVNPQLVTAAQLAVNTIDFADSDQIPSKLVLNLADSTSVTVLGVEKQPYITEVYAKVAEKYVDLGSGPTKDDGASRNASVYAVEIYNPYNANLALDGYQLVGVSASADLGAAAYAVLRDASNEPRRYMLPHEVLVLSNLDQATTDPTATSTFRNAPFDGGVGSKKIIQLSGMEITPDVAVQLVRTQAVSLNPSGFPSLLTTEITVIDQISKSDAFVIAKPINVGAHVVSKKASFAETNLGLAGEGENEPVKVASSGVTYWRHTSIQRHKEPDTTNPVFWHFTLAKEAAFQSRVYDDSDPGNSDGNPVHGLLGSGYIVSNDLAEFVDLTTIPTDVAKAAALNGALRFHSIAPMPIVVSDAGLDESTFGITAQTNKQAGLIGAAAFPTTGSLLLVTRGGHLSYNGVLLSSPMTVSAASDSVAIQKYDNNHMPVWDSAQTCLDSDPTAAGNNGKPQGRFDVPWGQMVFSYFTALPLEELTITGFLNANDLTYQNNYIQAYGYTDAGGNFLYSLCPMLERATDAPALYGPRVRGRININMAPWWVLDGLPVLPRDVRAATTDKPVTGLPATELVPSMADPSTAVAWPAAGDPSFALKAGQRPGYLLSYALLDEKGRMDSTVGPNFAKFMESYRGETTFNGAGEPVSKRVVGGVGLPLFTTDPGYITNPGFVTPGAVCNIIPRVPIQATMNGVLLAPMVVDGLRLEKHPSSVAQVIGTSPPYPVENSRLRPFSYLGYLQMVAPIVRLQDWVTTKSHVYTVYNLITDNNDTWLRSQTTIDRTRCLYTNDLPDKITATDPINYFNVMGDQ